MIHYNTSKECIICHYWYFLDKEFKFQPSVCNLFHDLLMMSININSIAILNIHGIVVLLMELAKVKPVMKKNADLGGEWNIKNYKFYLSYIKIFGEILFFNAN